MSGDYRRDLGRIFETAEQWKEWAAARDLPLAAVRDVEDEEDENAFVSELRGFYERRR